jgi:starvation-inducible DNA-binding protein
MKQSLAKGIPAVLNTPTDLSPAAVAAISETLRRLLADVFALYLKTKNFHWHMSGSHFRDYHLLLDEQAAEILAMTDPIAERTRKIGGTTLRSITTSNPPHPRACSKNWLPIAAV